MIRLSIALAATLGFLIAPTPAVAACRLSKYVDIPVTMAGRQPIVTAQINGRDARLILDSGAFFSTIAKANAQEYGLSVRNLAPGARLKGIGGDTSMGAATAKEFRIAGVALQRIDFVVGGSDTGFAGLLGQSLLGLTDVSYDLPHGIVSLMKDEGCKNDSMAYWAGSKPVTMMALEPMGATQRHTIGTIMIADFDEAVTMAPGDAHYLVQRAMARFARREPLLAASDLDKAIAIAPNDSEARLARAQLRLQAHDRDGALGDLRAADHALAPSSDARLQLAGCTTRRTPPMRRSPATTCG